MKHLLFLLLMPMFVFGQYFVLTENVEYLDDLDAVVRTKRFQDSTWRDTTVDSTINYYPEGYTCFVPGCKRHGNPEIKGDPSGKFAIKGSDGIKVHEADNGMIRITRKESDAEFWRRKYADLLKSHLELVERKIVE